MFANRNILVLTVLLLISGTAGAQPYLVSGSIEHAALGKIYLASYYGDRFRITDSMEAVSGSFLFCCRKRIPREYIV